MLNLDLIKIYLDIFHIPNRFGKKYLNKGPNFLTIFYGDFVIEKISSVEFELDFDERIKLNFSQIEQLLLIIQCILKRYSISPSHHGFKSFYHVETEIGDLKNFFLDCCQHIPS